MFFSGRGDPIEQPRCAAADEFHLMRRARWITGKILPYRLPGVTLGHARRAYDPRGPASAGPLFLRSTDPNADAANPAPAAGPSAAGNRVRTIIAVMTAVVPDIPGRDDTAADRADRGVAAPDTAPPGGLGRQGQRRDGQDRGKQREDLRHVVTDLRCQTSHNFSKDRENFPLHPLHIAKHSESIVPGPLRTGGPNGALRARAAPRDRAKHRLARFRLQTKKAPPKRGPSKGGNAHEHDMLTRPCLSRNITKQQGQLFSGECGPSATFEPGMHGRVSGRRPNLEQAGCRHRRLVAAGGVEVLVPVDDPGHPFVGDGITHTDAALAVAHDQHRQQTGRRLLGGDLPAPGSPGSRSSRRRRCRDRAISRRCRRSRSPRAARP